ncbi:glycosyl hydrolase catalytic core-domain-containing protein, partial [Mycena filopes]
MTLRSFSETILVYFFLIVAVAADKAPKRGLAFLTLNVAASSISADTHTAVQSNGLASWVYDWGHTPPAALLQSGLEYIPMQWNAEGIEDFAATVKSLGAKTILAFNEPDSATQSNINATYAAQLWMQYFEPLKATNVRLGAPAISSAESGPIWLAQFMAACAKCSIDFIPIHWYGSGTQNFFNYLGQLNKQFPNHPLWVTEFAESSADPAAVLSFMDITVPALDGPAFLFV